jgi:tetratricopeptide (TPR) repeat protein
VEAGPQSIHAHESAIAIYAARGDRLSEGIELVNLADAYWSSGLLDEAVTLGEKMLKFAPSLGAEVDDVARICHANTLASLGDWRRAEALYEQGIQIARRIDNRWDAAYGLLYYALLWFDERCEWRPDGFAEAIRVAEDINSPYLHSLGIALDLLCRIESLAGCDREDATLRLDLAEQIAVRTGAVGGQFYATVARCLLLHNLGERRGAALAARRVLRLHASYPYIKWRPELGVLVATRTLRWASSRRAPDSALGRACSQLLAKAYTIGETQRRQHYLREPWINRDLLALGAQHAVAI